MARPLTLLESFNIHLPDITITGPAHPQQANPSSTAVGAETLPGTFIAHDKYEYELSAETYLKANASQLSNEAATPPEPVRRVHNEADVVGHARNSLLFPIMRAVDINADFTGKVSLSAEQYVKKLRVDIGIVYEPKPIWGTVMMVEFKKANLINKDAYKGVMYDDEQLDKNLEPLVPDKDKRLPDNGTETNLMKQAKAYARRKKCLFVALCDYESLLLLKFSKDMKAVYVTNVQKSEITFRKALLGFLLEAIKHYNDEPSV